MKTFVRLFLFFLLAPSVLADDFPELVATNCLHCHDDSTAEGELDLTRLGSLGPEQDARVFERMLARVGNGEMPPPDDGSLERSTQHKFVALLEERLDSLAEQLKNDPGDVQMIRLTPYEYRNIMRDLSGGVFTDGGRFLPNEGGAGEGFANVGAAQSMSAAQYEKYVDAAMDTLRHVRFYPWIDGHTTSDAKWTSFPRPSVNEATAARKEGVDEIIAWHIGQQQRWGEEHREDLKERLGFVHPAYLEAAWRYQTRTDDQASIESFAWVPIDANRPDQKRLELAPAALKKWVGILNRDDSGSTHASWGKAWRELPDRPSTPIAEIRQRCIKIFAGDPGTVIETEDYAPEYEISFHEAKEEVLAAAEKEGHWPFRIDIGDAKELFLVVTDAGDGGRGEYAVWRMGRFVYRDGTSKRWQDAITVLGANSGKTYPFGYDGENEPALGPDAVGAKPPGALKFAVPKDAIVFEVDLTLDKARTKTASIQALVLKNKPKSQSYIPGRYVFGGKKRPVSAGTKLRKEHERALRKRNVAEANKTKVGLNAERNVFANWTRTSLSDIGGPWPDHEPDKWEKDFPYHYTVPEVLQNADEHSLVELNSLQNRLAALVRCEQADRDRLAVGTIRNFAEQLWRRRLNRNEIQHLVRLYENSRDQGLSFDSSLKSAILGILISPDFLFRGGSGRGHEPPRNESTGRDGIATSSTTTLSSEALASRLSFFLWASIPDAELRKLASEGQLQDVSVLKKQARRMLNDPRAKSLATDFAGQLWGFTDFGSFENPAPDRFASFTPELRKSMQLEVEIFLTNLIQEGLPLTSLLDSDYTFANKVLAEHYGIPWPDADATTFGEFKRVELPAGRGGLSTMGLFLTKTSLPLRTSPVQRGVWLTESILGRHLPNPPADVPSLSEGVSNTDGENILQQLARHRADESCASCHDKIDPLGISLESFDAIGRWRESLQDGSKLSNTATTHDGVRLDGAGGLKKYLKANQTEFIEHFNRKLLGYALGRSVNIGDRALLRQMTRSLERHNFAFSSLVETVVASPQFRTQRREQP